MTRRSAICATVLLVLLLSQTPAHAVATIETVVSAVSLAAGKVAVVGAGTVVVGGGAVVKVSSTSWWGDLAGDLLVIGGIAIAVLDPPAGTFYGGSWTLHYPANLFETGEAGWLGDWGDTPSDAAPPADPLGFPDETLFVVHAASPSLAAVIVDDPVAGLQTTTFDWGPVGHSAAEAGPFNMFAALFEAKETVRMQFLGTSSAASPLSGSNFFVSSPGISCSLPGSDLITTCGEPETQYFFVSAVPAPATWLVMIAGIGTVGAVMRRGRRRATLPAA